MRKNMQEMKCEMCNKETGYLFFGHWCIIYAKQVFDNIKKAIDEISKDDSNKKKK